MTDTANHVRTGRGCTCSHFWKKDEARFAQQRECDCVHAIGN